jgi:carboxylesterase type B/inosine-uridine nucleoside N-ribohydrolase
VVGRRQLVIMQLAGRCAVLLSLAQVALAAPAIAPAPPPSQHSQPSTLSRQAVIIDTDIGDDIDDAFALTVALQDPNLQVLGVTTAWGDTRTRTLLVRRLLATLGRRDVVVAEGPATQSSTPFTQRKWALGAADGSPAPDAIEFIREQVHKRPGEITLIALAPLSNIQALKQRDAGALRQLKQVVLMGGSIHAGYNQGGAIPVAEPSAEYNVAAAPQGLRDLLGSGVQVRMFPLDSTQLKFDEVRRARLFAYGSPASDALALLYHQWRLLNGWGQITPTLFDVVPVVWLLRPAACPVSPLRIAVDDRGFTRPVAGAANVEVCLALDEDATQRLIMDHLAPPQPAPAPIVQTTGGAVAGSEGNVRAFKGIPYAAPPIGSLRWRPPQPPVPWQGVRDASRFGEDCEQVPYVIPTGQSASEDCLTVNVWTPAHRSGERLPVMVFVYGGGFIGGSAAYPLYDAAKLAAHGVVVVSFNYRVGVFGFLAHPQLSQESPQHASGNYGLLDQIAALNWVKANIAAFGGDAGRVTAFGESAGAVSIAVLMTSPLAHGLFSQAILHSPTLPPLASLAAAERRGAALGSDVVALRQVSAAELLTHNGEFFVPQTRKIMPFPFPAPIVDGYVVPRQPRAVFQDGVAHAVPAIVGIAADEGRMFTANETVAGYQAWLRDAFAPVADQLLRLEPATTDASARTAVATLRGDATFGESARLIARGIAPHQPRTFFYLFSHSVAGAAQPATHSEILPFLFGSLDEPSFIRHPPAEDADWQLSAAIMQAWTRFAERGDPNGADLPHWPAYERGGDPYLEFGTAIRAGHAYHKTQLDILEQLDAHVSR